MARLLFLVHRMPYPPDKGDKVRSYHLLRQLAAGHRVHVGCFVDDADDERHVDTLRAQCAGLYVRRLHPAASFLARIFSLQDRPVDLILPGSSRPRHRAWDDKLYRFPRWDWQGD